MAAAVLGMDEPGSSGGQVGQQRLHLASHARNLSHTDSVAASAGAPPSQRMSHAAVKAHADEAQLQKALPLMPKARTKVPLMLYAPQVRVRAGCSCRRGVQPLLSRRNHHQHCPCVAPGVDVRRGRGGAAGGTSGVCLRLRRWAWQGDGRPPQHPAAPPPLPALPAGLLFFLYGWMLMALSGM